MEPLDRNGKALNAILKGNWSKILPEDTYSDLLDWFNIHKSKKEVVVRFLYYDQDDEDGPIKAAMHIICSPKIKKNVVIKDAILPDDTNILGIPHAVYEKPLFCIPDSYLLNNFD